MEQIKNIEIKNFKSIRHAKIEDCRRINVFIGYPNVGKSNVLEALSLFTDFQNASLKDLIRLKEDTTIFFNSFLNNTIEVIANANHKVIGNYKNAQFKLSYSYLGDSGYFEIGGFNFDKNFTEKEGWVEVKRGEVIPLPVRKYEFNKHSGKNGQGYERLNTPYGENIFNVIRANQFLMEEVSSLFKPYDLKLLYNQTAQEFNIVKLVGSSFVAIPYELIADTLQRLIFFKTAIYSNVDSILLLEEPEAHMFPPYISKFTGDIWYNKSNQYFISTHSPFVINDFMENAKDELSIYALDYKDGETTIKPLTDQDIHEAYQYGLDLFLNMKSFVE